jgi:hypothetical protein
MKESRWLGRWLGAAVLALAATGAWAQTLGWQQLPGAAYDVGVGGPNNTAWVIGTNAEGGGYGIYRWNGSNNWEKIPGSAVRLDVDPQGNAWVVNNSHNIYRFDGRGFVQMPGQANDIGIGANGTVWVIGNDRPSPNDYGIYRLGAGNTWTRMPGWAVRIDVDPQGNAWVINSTNNIFRWDGSKWVQLPGAAIDIGIGADGTVFVVGTDQGIYKWTGATWAKMDGGLTNISVDNKGRPWGVNAGRQIYAAATNGSGPAPSAGVPAYVAAYAPLLRFDSGSAGYSYPMSADEYFKRVVAANSGITRLENNDPKILNTGQVPIYYTTQQVGRQTRIRYWIFYGFQAPCEANQRTHNGDWEDVTVITKEGGSGIAAVLFGQHGGHYMRIAGSRDAPCTAPGSCAGRGGFEMSGTHPVAYIGRTAHGTFHDTSGGMPSAGQCLYYGDSRDGRGPTFETWHKLVSLDGNDETWLARDRQQNFPWGPDGVNTHPTMMHIASASCTGSALDPTGAVNGSGCYKSECLSGDDEAVGSCIRECKPGYSNVGLTCNKGKWPWDWSIYGRLDSGTRFGYAFNIRSTDAGLARRRGDGGEWSLP